MKIKFKLKNTSKTVCLHSLIFFSVIFQRFFLRRFLEAPIFLQKILKFWNGNKYSHKRSLEITHSVLLIYIRKSKDSLFLLSNFFSYTVFLAICNLQDNSLYYICIHCIHVACVFDWDIKTMWRLDNLGRKLVHEKPRGRGTLVGS